MEEAAEPHESETVGLVKWGRLPVNVTNWVFKEARNILEGSPFLGHVLGLLLVLNKFSPVTISLLSERSNRIYQKQNCRLTC